MMEVEVLPISHDALENHINLLTLNLGNNKSQKEALKPLDLDSKKALDTMNFIESYFNEIQEESELNGLPIDHAVIGATVDTKLNNLNSARSLTVFLNLLANAYLNDRITLLKETDPSTRKTQLILIKEKAQSALRTMLDQPDAEEPPIISTLSSTADQTEVENHL